MSRKLKIGMVCYPTFGGSGVIATELGKGLAKEGYEIHFITYAQPHRLNFLSENIFYHEVTILPYPLFDYPPYELALASRIVSVIKDKKLDLLHAHYAIPHASAAYLARHILSSQGIFVPIITTLHGTDITLVGKDPSYEPVVTFSINRSDGITAVSNDLRDQTLRFFDVTREIKVIPNFIDFKSFKRLCDSPFRKAVCPDGEALIVHVSNFRKVKRIEDVVRIFNYIHKKIPAKLVMVGDGPDRLVAEKLCRDLGICDDTRFLGKVEAIGEVLAVADLFLMPSEKESFGLAALEAMACGVPVISSDIGGIPELNIHGVTGFLSPVGAIEEMGKNALLVLKKENLSGFKENARKQAVRFDISNVLPLYKEYYGEIVSGANKPNASPKAR